MAAIASSVYRTPGVYIEEVPSSTNAIVGVGTSTPAFVGTALDVDAHLNEPRYIENFASYLRLYAKDLSNRKEIPAVENVADLPGLALTLAIKGFFDNGGTRCCVVNHGNGEMTGGGLGERRGLDVLETVDDVQIVCAPGHTTLKDHTAIIAHCTNMKDRFAILSPPRNPGNLKNLTVAAVDGPAPRPSGPAKPGDVGKPADAPASSAPPAVGVRPPTTDVASLYFPWVVTPNPLGGPSLATDPSGHIAGVYARTDSSRGVHKAPANEVVRGITGLDYYITAAEQGDLNSNGVNVLRMISGAPRVWGARTLSDLTSMRYTNVKRTLIMIEQSIQRGTGWVVFEPNAEPLWKSIRRDVGRFLTGIYNSGALVGRTPQEAFFVKCDAENNPQDSIDLGFVIVDVGVAIVRPAEFIVFRIGQTEREEGNVNG